VTTSHFPDRRAVLLEGLGLAVALSACSHSSREPSSTSSPPPPPTSGETTPPAAAASRTLLVYFSRAGENYFNGGRIDLEVGNTQVLAGLIENALQTGAGGRGCDVHRLEPAEAYPDDYDDTVARNVEEQDAEARPALVDPIASIEGYDTILIGSPVWNVRPPIMATFAQAHDFSGKTVHPLVTYAVSGLGKAERDYCAWCPGAQLGDGLAVRGEAVGDPDGDVGDEATNWLRTIGLLAA